MPKYSVAITSLLEASCEITISAQNVIKAQECAAHYVRNDRGRLVDQRLSNGVIVNDIDIVDTRVTSVTTLEPDPEPCTIDVTPTWEAIVPTLLVLHEQATTPEARKTALDELTRMAQLADLYVKGR